MRGRGGEGWREKNFVLLLMKTIPEFEMTAL